MHVYANRACVHRHQPDFHSQPFDVLEFLKNVPSIAPQLAIVCPGKLQPPILGRGYSSALRFVLGI